MIDFQYIMFPESELLYMEKAYDSTNKEYPHALVVHLRSGVKYIRNFIIQFYPPL